MTDRNEAWTRPRKDPPENTEERGPLSRKPLSAIIGGWSRWSAFRIPIPPPSTRPKAYALALLIPAVTGCVQDLLVPLVTLAPFILFFLAVFLVSWLGGRGPGLVASLVSAAIANYWFLPPHGWSFSHRELILVALFLVVSTIINLLSASVGEAVRDARLAADLWRKSEARSRSKSQQLFGQVSGLHGQ